MKKQFLQNKKADIPVMILVLGVVAICTLAIASFIFSESKEIKDPLGVGLFEEIHSDLEKFYFYSNALSKEIAADKINSSIDLDRNQLIIERQILSPKKIFQAKSESFPPVIFIRYVIDLKE